VDANALKVKEEIEHISSIRFRWELFVLYQEIIIYSAAQYQPEKVGFHPQRWRNIYSFLLDVPSSNSSSHERSRSNVDRQVREGYAM